MYEFSTFTHYTKLLCSCILTMNTKTKNTISFYHHLKKKKNLDINLTKYVQVLYEENYKTLMKESK